MSSRGRLILIEGLDRSGKSTQAAYLQSKFPDSKLIKFPDRTTNIGKIINEYLTDENFILTDESAHLLFSANRWELVNDIINHLNNGYYVILDRYIYSGIAYSLAKSKSFSISSTTSTTSSLQMSNENWLYSPDKGLPKPDLTLFLTLDVETLSNRKGWGDERYEKFEFQKIVKSCFLKILNIEIDKSIELIDVNNLSINEVSNKIWNVIETRKINQLTANKIDTFI